MVASPINKGVKMAKLSDKLRARMEKLLAMSRDKVSPNEAAIANKRLHAMLAEYNLSIHNLDELSEDVKTEIHKIMSSPWNRVIAKSIANLYFCNMYFCPMMRGARMFMCITGSEVNREFAAQLIKNVIRTIGREARAESRGRYNGVNVSSFITSFQNAAAFTIKDRCSDLITSAKEGTLEAEDGSMLPSLVPVYSREEDKVNDYLERQNVVIEHTESKVTSRNMQGYVSGEAAGKRVNLHRSLERSSSNAIEMQ